MQLKALAKIRWPVIAAVTVLTLGTAVIILGTAFWGWRFGMTGVDLPTRINTVVAVCAFILVAATLFVALTAYLAATGRPDLEPQLRFYHSYLNKPVLRVEDEPSPNGWRNIVTTRQTECSVTLVNRSRYSARNPGLQVWLEGLGGLKEQPGWAVVGSANMIGITAIQWDGGADYLIHGKWSRVLPPLIFDGAFVYATDTLPALIVTVAADGIKPQRKRMPVEIMDSHEYDEYFARRAIDLKGLPEDDQAVGG
jgi:hypothetical protein